MSFLKILFSFSGRIDRAQYWFGALVPMFICGAMVACAFTTIASLFGNGHVAPLTVINALGKLILPVAFGIIMCVWITAALYTKRLHDRGKGAIWLLVIYVPAFLPLISTFYFPKAILVVGLISFVSSLWNFIELGCMGSESGPNRFDGDASTNKYAADPRNWDAPHSGGQSPNLGGMAAAMASIEVAARENRAAARAQVPATSSQFGQRAPQQFGQLSPGTAGGFGRRGL